MAQLYRIEHLQTALAQDKLILTPNRRIATKIKQAWGDSQKDKVLKTPKVFSAHDWLDQITYSTQAAPKKLSDIECLLLWERIISNTEHGLLMPSAAIAELMASADDLLIQWCIDYRFLPNDPDSKLLKKCIASFEKELELHLWTNTYRHHKSLEKAFSLNAISKPDVIVLTGFDDITPLFKKILKSTGAELVTISTLDILSDTKCTKTVNATSEIYAAALWAQQKVRTNKESGNLDYSIGIIIPDLDSRRTEIERLLQSIFEPQTILPEEPRYSLPFNISAGCSLAEQAIVSSALQLLALNYSTLSQNYLLSLLHSPFWSDHKTETAERIYAELRLRKKRWDKMSITDFRSCLKENGPILTRLNHFEKIRIRHNKAQYPSEWLSIIQEQLTTLGWPGSRRLDSIEYQQVGQLQRVLDQFISLDNILGKISFGKAVQTIHELCLKTIFHSQTQESPIQVLGLLEGSGLHFDAVWICGMSAQSWPTSTKPHPLLPLSLQIEHNMPHSSVNREKEYCEKITRDLLNCAEKIIISYPAFDDERNQRISNLFSTIKEFPIESIINENIPSQHPYLCKIINQKDWLKEWELIKDNQGPILNDMKTQGGQGLLKEQALNPFDAFAKYRLNAMALDEPELGLPKIERGILIHAALHYFWKTFYLDNNLYADMSSHAALLKLNNSNQELLIDASIEFALIKSKHPALLNENFRAVEMVQLKKHIRSWLEIEKQRPSFTVVALEKSIKFVLNNIELSLMIDRVDKLSDGSLLLIDYKTTSANLSPQAWLDLRPEEPQLPLYCIACENTSGISFAQINISTMKFVSMGMHPDVPELKNNISSKNDWSEQKIQWQKVLDALMQEYKDGYAAVRYRDGKIPEHSSDLQSLNRWAEKELIDDLISAQSTK